MDEKVFIVIRVYPDDHTRDHVYGWSESKKIIQAFMKQRSSDKYQVFRMTSEELAQMFSENAMEATNQIDYFKIQSAHTGDTVVFFTTKDEMMEAERKIQKYFRELPHLIEHADGREEAVHLFTRLRKKYAEALDYLGFRPEEVEMIYDRDDWIGDNGELSIDAICEMIENNYSEKAIDEYRNGWDNSKKPLGTITSDDIYPRLLTSLESFIMVLKEEM